MTTQPSKDEVRAARRDWCQARRHPNHVVRWLAWLYLRALLEGDRLTAAEKLVLTGLLQQGDAWRRGERPPTSVAEATRRFREATGR